jgi:DnaK suppressor protein
MRSAKATLSSADLESLKRILAEKRTQLLSLYEHDVRVGQESNDDNADDFVDRANNAFNRELMFSLSDNERETLLLVEEAVARLNNPSEEFGSCTHCGEPIGLARLKALPWARYCIRCQELDELGALEH